MGFAVNSTSCFNGALISEVYGAKDIGVAEDQSNLERLFQSAIGTGYSASAHADLEESAASQQEARLNTHEQMPFSSAINMLNMSEVLLHDPAKRQKGLESRLRKAARRGHQERVAQLLAQKTDVNAPDRFGETPLSKAAAAGHKDIVDTLIEHGASIDVRDGGGCTALMMAANFGQKETFETLVSHGADLNIQNKEGGTALMIAAFSGVKESVEVLIQQGADLNLTTSDGATAAVYMMMNPNFGNAHFEMLKLLIEQGINLRAFGTKGDSIASHVRTRVENKQWRKNLLELIEKKDPQLAMQAREFVHLKSLGHAFSLQGRGEMQPKAEGLSGKYDLEYGVQQYWLRKMSTATKAMANDHKYADMLPKESADMLFQTLQYSADMAGKTHLEILARIRKGLPTLIPTGFKEHAVALLFWGPYMVLCNKGEAARMHPAEIFKFDPAKLDGNILKQIRELPFHTQTDYERFFFSVLPNLLDLSKDSFANYLQPASRFLGPQIVANCTWESPATAVFALLSMQSLLGSEEGKLNPPKEGAVLGLTRACTQYSQWLAFNQVHILKHFLEVNKADAPKNYKTSPHIFDAANRLNKSDHKQLNDDIGALKQAIGSLPLD